MSVEKVPLRITYSAGCMQSLPCQHRDVCVEFSDLSRDFIGLRVDGPTIARTFIKYGLEVPAHFKKYLGAEYDKWYNPNRKIIGIDARESKDCDDNNKIYYNVCLKYSDDTLYVEHCNLVKTMQLYRDCNIELPELLLNQFNS